MSELLSTLRGESCESRNISQKATIEYLRRYGYEKEVEVLLKKLWKRLHLF
ncbi:hypothetical protein SAMN04488156_10411 [Bacillus sp. 166amftsu]|nr:hypothetical protein SAMN04488156_10411 [Bacillus sp. 166amftsu]